MDKDGGSKARPALVLVVLVFDVITELFPLTGTSSDFKDEWKDPDSTDFTCSALSEREFGLAAGISLNEFDEEGVAVPFIAVDKLQCGIVEEKLGDSND